MHRRLIVVALVAAVPLVLGADQSAPLRPLSAVQLEGGAVRQAPAAQGQPVAPQAQAPLPPRPVTRLDQTPPNPELDNTTISLTLDGPQPVRDLIDTLISEETNLTLIIDPSIDATFIGQLRNRTIRQALDLITEQANLDYSVRDDVVRVFPRELETRLYSIDYVITQRSGSRGLSASTGTSGGSGGAGGTTGGATTGGATAGASAGGGASGSGGGGGGGSSSVGGSDAPSFYEDLEAGVGDLLTADGTMTIDKTAGIMRVTDITSRLDRVDAYFEAVMQRVTRQVRIEARVIEVELREEFQAGINWDAVFRLGANTLSLGQTLPRSGSFTLAGNIDDNFTALVNLFKTQGDVNVRSSPSVLAMNNQPAVIQAGTLDVFFNSTTQRDPQGTIIQQTVTPQTVTVGVVLSVTAQISSDGIIHMSMNPSITDSAGTATSPLGDTVPIITTRSTDTLVRVRDGETIVIAGLMQDRTSQENTKVPILGDVPLLGRFFRSTIKRKTKSDLVIMLTPTIEGPTDVAGSTAREIRRIDGAQRTAASKR